MRIRPYRQRTRYGCVSGMFGLLLTRNIVSKERSFLMRQLQLIAHGEPSDVIELNTVSEPALGQEDVLISMEAAPLNPSDFLFVRGTYGVRPAFPSSVGAEGVGRVAKIGSKVDVALQSKRVLIIPTYEQGTWADQVVAPVRNLVPMSDEADPMQLAMIPPRPVQGSVQAILEIESQRQDPVQVLATTEVRSCRRSMNWALWTAPILKEFRRR